MMASIKEYKRNNFSDVISSADLNAVERAEERKIREAFNIKATPQKIDYQLCKEYDNKEYQKFHEAAGLLLNDVMDNIEKYFGEVTGSRRGETNEE